VTALVNNFETGGMCKSYTVTLFAVVHTYCIHYVEARIWSMASARLPLKSVWQPTKVEPFNLNTEEWGHQHSTKWLQNRCVSLANLHVCALGGTYIQWWYNYPFAFEVIEVSFTGWRRFSESKAGGKIQGQRSLCSL